MLHYSTGIMGLACLSWGGCLSPQQGAYEAPSQQATADPPASGRAADTPPVTPPVAIDLLFVVDNTRSMCEEQAGLSAAFADLAALLGRLGEFDLRVAVVTPDMQCDPQAPGVQGRSMGRFNRVAAHSFPASCQRAARQACLKDADCDAALGDPGQWTCDPGSGIENKATCLKNPNCTLNSSCKRRCLEDADCADYLGEPHAVCQKPSGSEADWGCLLPPPTQDCPAELPAFLTGDNLELFPCLASVGINQEKCLRWEQGLEAGWAALDKDGPNAEQAAEFLRDDAYLAIIFVTDEDDCSTVPGAEDDLEFDKARCAMGAAARRMEVAPCASSPWSDGDHAACGDLESPQYNQCLWNEAAFALASESPDGGLLNPTALYVERYKALKADPRTVIVTAVSGDSQAHDAAEIARERREFVLSKGNRFHCFADTYVCSSENGVADWGSRYQAVAEGFGDHGLFANICGGTSASPLASAMTQVADLLLQVVPSP